MTLFSHFPARERRSPPQPIMAVFAAVVGWYDPRRRHMGGATWAIPPTGGVDDRAGLRAEMNVAAIIFDFDGVIVESVDIKTRAFATLFQSEPASVVQAVVDYHLANAGLSRYVKFAYVYEVLLRRPLDDATALVLESRFSSLVTDQVVACPMVAGARSYLDARRGEVPLHLVSATPQGELREIVGRRALACYFEDVMGSPATKAANVRRVIDRHGYDPARVPLIGDGLQDHEAARALGLPFIGRVPPGQRSPFPACTSTVPDLDALARSWPDFAAGPLGTALQ
jgi:phosphoglycolate phosphatase-like HAD superfamily hydrolase